ncbi:uncharacterized protein PV09_06377 [Verruconis gallopava]|uniref:Mid2 domain-containing protein n=1 Tax=Verruconis gallopava TaxID=253628 RepID=A0A0D2A648_9PEZI|nr:uncharacterized protein PV09_06377 [Verruconis gallopava]KIW02223.1 hypothetical protein PV09_06377 [Verruconis gallopava]
MANMETATVTSGTAAVPVFPPLTTTFTPPAACATQFMMLQIDQNQIWMNPLTPANGITATSCYASQWLQSSSQVAFSPLVCPSGYQTQTAFASPAGYIACCPDGFEGLSLTANAPDNRPASGATCYSGIFSSAILVTEYNSSAIVTSTVLTATDFNAQVYAYAYDGFAASSGATSSSKKPSQNSGSSGASSTSTPGSQSTSSLGGGVIAGIVVGVIVAIALFVGLVGFCLHRRRKRNQEENAVHEVHGESTAHGTRDSAGGFDSAAGHESKDKKNRRISELSAERRTSELAASSTPLLELQEMEWDPATKEREREEKRRRESGVLGGTERDAG